VVVAAPEKIVGLKKESTIYLWVVPARVAGYWRGTLTGPGGEESVVIEFAQRFQNASANVWLRRWNLTGTAHLQGNRLSLSLDRSPWMPDSAPLRFTLHIAKGRLSGEAMDGDKRYTLGATRLPTERARPETIRPRFARGAHNRLLKNSFLPRLLKRVQMQGAAPIGTMGTRHGGTHRRWVPGDGPFSAAD